MQIPNQNSSSPKRREVLKSLPLLLASSSDSFSSPQASGRPPRRTVRDSLWLWSHVAGSYNGAYNLPGKSRISPAEAAYYMSIPNIYMIHLKDKPEPPLEQYALAFKPLREVVWGIVAAGGHTNSNEREMVLDLVAHDDQITGVVMDDFQGLERVKSRLSPLIRFVSCGIGLRELVESLIFRSCSMSINWWKSSPST